MVHDNGVPAALGLAAFARIVDNKGINQWHVPQKQVRKAFTRQSHRFSGKPFQGSMLADMDDRVGAPAAFFGRRRKPLIEGSIMMSRGQISGVVNRIWIQAVPSRRLKRD